MKNAAGGNFNDCLDIPVRNVDVRRVVVLVINANHDAEE